MTKPFTFQLIFFSLFILTSHFIKGQISESYFSDVSSKENGSIYCHLKLNNTILIGGSTFENLANFPFILLVDETGNVLWNTRFNDNSVYTNSNVYIQKMILGNDNFIYATCMDSDNSNRELWKIDVTNGTIIWKKSFNLFNPVYTLPRHLVDFDSTRFIVSYSSLGFDRFAFISKLSGDTISTYFPGTGGVYGLCVDPQKNIYFSKDDSLFKINGNNIYQSIWKTKHASALVGNFNSIYYDTGSGSVFYIGNKKFGYTKIGKILKINSTDGSLISDYSASTSDVACQEFKISGNFMYLAWRHIYVGGGAYAYWATKYDMNSGTAAWSSYSTIVGFGTPVSQHSGSAQGPMSIDIDNYGDVYMTGYYGDANYGPENWGLIKLNGNDGSKAYEKTITNDSTTYNDLSVGMAACVFGSSPCFIGNLQTKFTVGSEKTKLTFVKLNPVTGNIVLKKYLEDLQFPSRTVAIKNYSPANSVVLKQMGRKIVVEMYTSLNQLSWTKSLSRNYFLGGSNLSVAPNGDIFVSAYSKSKNNYFPYYTTNTDSINFFQLNSSGTLIKGYSFAVGLPDVYPVELYTDNSSTIGLYKKSSTLYFRKIEAYSLSAEQPVSLNYTMSVFPKTTAVNLSETKLILFGNSLQNVSVLQIDKPTLNVTTVAMLAPSVNKINNVVLVDSSRVVLSGKSVSNKDMVVLYDIAINDTIWTKQLSANSEVVKCVVSDDQKYIYVASFSASDIVIRKLAVSNGQTIWSHNSGSSLTIENFPLDLLYDHLRGQIVVSGYETELSNDKSVMIIVIDSTGNAVNTIKKKGEFEGDNYASCVHLSPNGTLWMGGNLNTLANGLAGFLYRLDVPITTSLAEYNGENSYNFIVFPNPAGHQTILRSSKKLSNANLFISNSLGEIVKKIENISGETVTIDRGYLENGMYILKLTEGSSPVFTGKILFADE